MCPHTVCKSPTEQKNEARFFSTIKMETRPVWASGSDPPSFQCVCVCVVDASHLWVYLFFIDYPHSSTWQEVTPAETLQSTMAPDWGWAPHRVVVSHWNNYLPINEQMLGSQACLILSLQWFIVSAESRCVSLLHTETELDWLASVGVSLK